MLWLSLTDFSIYFTLFLCTQYLRVFIVRFQLNFSLSFAREWIHFFFIHFSFIFIFYKYIFRIVYFTSKVLISIFAYTSEKCLGNALLQIQLTWQESVTVSAIIIIKWTCILSDARRSKKAVNCTLWWLFLLAIK